GAAAGAAQPVVPVRGPRPVGGAPHRQPGGGHVPGADRRDRRRRPGVRRPGPPLHPGAAVGHPAARPPPGTGTAPHRPPGRPAQPGRPAVGLPVPHPLPAVRHADRHPAAALHRRGAGRGQPGAGPRRRLPLRPGENGSVEPGGTMPGKRIPAAAAALVLALSALAGCGGGSKKNESGGDSGTGLGKNGAPATTLDINEAARDKVADGGTLRWPLDQIPPNLNYNEIDGTLRDTADVVSATMPELFFYDAEAVPSINKAYLDSAELT